MRAQVGKEVVHSTAEHHTRRRRLRVALAEGTPIATMRHTLPLAQRLDTVSKAHSGDRSKEKRHPQIVTNHVGYMAWHSIRFLTRSLQPAKSHHSATGHSDTSLLPALNYSCNEAHQMARDRYVLRVGSHVLFVHLTLMHIHAIEIVVVLPALILFHQGIA